MLGAADRQSYPQGEPGLFDQRLLAECESCSATPGSHQGSCSPACSVSRQRHQFARASDRFTTWVCCRACCPVVLVFAAPRACKHAPILGLLSGEVSGERLTGFGRVGTAVSRSRHSPRCLGQSPHHETAFSEMKMCFGAQPILCTTLDIARRLVCRHPFKLQKAARCHGQCRTRHQLYVHHRTRQIWRKDGTM